MEQKEVLTAVLVIAFVGLVLFSGIIFETAPEEETLELAKLPKMPVAQPPPPSPTPVPIPTPILPTTRDSSKYSFKEVFIVTSNQWDALTYLPVAVWHENNLVKTYPYLILHTEGETFDPDSIIYFLEVYNPSSITLLGDVPGGFIELLDQEFPYTNAKQVSNVLDFWTTTDNIVYSEENYEMALLGTTVASLSNGPLIIEGSVDDVPANFNKKKIFVLGNLACPQGSRCTNLRTIQDIQRYILTQTNTDKVMLVHSGDENGESIGIVSDYVGELEISGFSKESLAAPILAAAKKELMFFAHPKDYQNINADFKEELNSLNLNPDYLTIVANPDFIPQDKPDPRNTNWRKEVDNSIYGDLDSDMSPDMAVGRMYGLTVSDTSSLIAKSLFYDEISSVDSAAFLWAPDFLNMLSEVYEMDIWATRIGLKSEKMILGNLDCSLDGVSKPLCNTLRYNLEDLEDKSIIVYEGHGLPMGGSVNNYDLNLNTVSFQSIRFKNSPIFLTVACSTCGYGKMKIIHGSSSNLFCINFLRRGGVAYFGAVEDASQPLSVVREGLLSLYSGKDLGTALKDLKTTVFHQGTILGNPASEIQDPHFILLGDPTLKIMEDRISRLNLQDSVTHDSRSKTIRINLPAVSQRNSVPFGFYTQAAPPGIYSSGRLYYDADTGKITTQHQLTSNLANNNIPNVQQRSFFMYLFSLPISQIRSITGDTINYADNTVGTTAEGVQFYTDSDGNTWFWFEEVFLQSLNGVPAREIVIQYS